MTQQSYLLLATKNAGKVAEFRGLLEGSGVIVDDLADKADAPDVEEVGSSFVENASIKAAAYARHFGAWALADDSGLCVDALAGKPGVHSARWAEMNRAGKGDDDNNRLLLEQLSAVDDDKRTARFVCALALADEEGRIVLTCQDAVEGTLVREPRGAGGFGYDPLFLIEWLGQTTAEMTPDEKHSVSHRGKAMRTMATMMRDAGLFQ